jgi:hypothetical protein
MHRCSHSRPYEYVLQEMHYVQDLGRQIRQIRRAMHGELCQSILGYLGNGVEASDAFEAVLSMHGLTLDNRHMESMRTG